MKRTCLLLLVALSAAAAAPAAFAAEASPPAPAPAPAPTAAVVPPALQALEQKMAQIRFNTARVSERFVIGDLGSTTGGADLGSGVGNGKSFVTAGVGSIRFAPSASLFKTHVEIPGEHVPKTLASTGQVRDIGKTTYTYTPTAASFDGGRPWVRSSHKPPPKPGSKAALLVTVLDSLAPALAGPSAGSAEPFATLVEYLGDAVNVSEGGSVTVDGEQTTEFTASLSIIKTLAGKLSRTQLAKIEKESRRKPSEGIVELEVFIASDGLPVRTIGSSAERTEGLGIQDDILALEVPFVRDPRAARARDDRPSAPPAVGAQARPRPGQEGADPLPAQPARGGLRGAHAPCRKPARCERPVRRAVAQRRDSAP